MPSQDAQRLQLLLEVGRLLSSKIELPELLSSVLELAARVVDAQTASLLLLDPATQELYFDVALGMDEAATKTRLKMGQGIAGIVAQTRKSEMINDVALDPRWSAQVDELSGFKTVSILAAAIQHKGRLIGVLEAINKNNGQFIAEDLEILEAFSSQVGVAIENARLFSQLREDKTKLGSDLSKVQKQQKLKRSFVSTISQKLKTPMSSIIDFSTKLSASFQGKTVDPDSVIARQVNAQVIELGQLVDKLMRYSTLENTDISLNLADVSVDQTVANVLKDLAEDITRKNAAIDFSPSNISLCADPALFTEVVKNLVQNALNFTKNNSPIVAIRAKADEKWAAFVVTDAGPGISPERQQQLLSSAEILINSDAGQEQLSLGLPFVKKVVELHGGKISLYSKVNEGTTISIAWPRGRL